MFAGWSNGTGQAEGGKGFTGSTGARRAVAWCVPCDEPWSTCSMSTQLCRCHLTLSGTCIQVPRRRDQQCECVCCGHECWRGLHKAWQLWYSISIWRKPCGVHGPPLPAALQLEPQRPQRADSGTACAVNPPFPSLCHHKSVCQIIVFSRLCV